MAFSAANLKALVRVCSNLLTGRLLRTKGRKLSA